MSGAADWLGLTGKVAVVTGAGGGIGRAVCAAMHGAGARVVALDRAADPIPGTMVLSCDMTTEASVTAAADHVARTLGGADILVNAAGILRPGPLETLSLQDWEAMIAVNLTGCFLGARAFGAQMLARGGGAIVHVASISASQPQPFSGAYSPGKAGVVMLSRQLASASPSTHSFFQVLPSTNTSVIACSEWGARGVRSNVVSPGLVRTPLSAAFYADNETLAARESMVPVGRIGDPVDTANAVLFLCSSRANYITGQEIIIDGGLSQVLMGQVPRPGYAQRS